MSDLGALFVVFGQYRRNEFYNQVDIVEQGRIQMQASLL